ncbi:hypothetical protein BJ165DRAFT_939568 [Panaeolus papilionaceus]|nr:hypothetical protein BJ165DRAFT_939568 [Panaeolus papilionaceus]
MSNPPSSVMASRRVTIANYQLAINSAPPLDSHHRRIRKNHDDVIIAGENVLDDGESEYDYSTFDFPAPPPFRSPVIRRVKSTPWYSTSVCDDICKALESTEHMLPVYDERIPSTSFEAFEDVFDLTEQQSSTPRVARPLISRLVKRASVLSFRDLTNWSTSEYRLENPLEQQKNAKMTKMRLPNVIRKVVSMSYESESDLKNKGQTGHERGVLDFDQSLAALGINYNQGIINASSDRMTNLAPAFQFQEENWNRQSREMNVSDGIGETQGRGNECSFMDITPERSVIPSKPGTKTDGIKRLIARAGGRILRWRTERNRTRNGKI